ncbi:hypothetical protein HFZ78_23935 [Priestia megaterium]|uniref:Uncharacterized protein n=1 Tax=Priestia megaterium TaxID=1404 RepID=A0A6H1P702_PRIMG|nr:hypothetical protein [Priestia megaterium]QIZ09370.1 hypothetical protein HFZ78_23935 [Priestia megaterium]
MEKYTTKKLCEQVLKIKYDSFTAHKKKYLDKLRLAYEVHVTEEKGITYYYLNPKNNLFNILNCDIGKRDINIIENILKVLIERKIIPVQDEIGKTINVPRGTVKSYMTFLRNKNIIVEPEKEHFITINVDGVVVNEWDEKKVAYVYYDIANDGTRIKLTNQSQVNRKYRELWRNAYQNKDYLHLVRRRANYRPLMAVIQEDIWEEVNQTFGLNNANRVAIPIINHEIITQLIDYFNQQDNVACV